jgi:hypothetical protein
MRAQLVWVPGWFVFYSGTINSHIDRGTSGFQPSDFEVPTVWYNLHDAGVR